MSKKDLLARLNPEQKEAVVTIDCPVKVVAGAGTGKTSVITTKISHLINHHHYLPWQILAVTFTNKAANEMKERVVKMTNIGDATPLILTYHALALRILRFDYEAIDLPRNFNIIDASDQKTIIRKITKEMFPGQTVAQKDFEKKALGQIRHWKNDLISPQIARNLNQNLYFDQLAKIYEAYERELKRNHSLDFDDLLLKARQVLKKDLVVREKWQAKFKYILVDEFQDTNQIQFEIIKLLQGESPHLTVVGDPDQTIYSWRGAKNEIINNFAKEFANVKTVILKRNYRSTQEILDLANDFIALNPHAELRKLEAQNKRGLVPHLQENFSARQEAEYIAKEIKRLKKKYNYQNNDFFVLYRSNYWSRNLEDVFFEKKLPFDLIGGIKFRDRKVIKDALAFLRVLLTNDDLSMERVLNVTPRIGEITINKLRLLSRESNRSIFDLLTAAEPLGLSVSKYLAPLRDAFIKARDKNNIPLATLTKLLLTESGYWEYIKSVDNDEHENIDYLNDLLDQLAEFDRNFNPQIYGTENRLLAYLQEEALANSEDQPRTPNKITLLTVHSAKGLENKVVFVAGLSHGVFPSIHSQMEHKNLEEERRLLYVAMTRAQERLYLTYVNGGYSFATRSEMRPSVFLEELNKKNFHWHYASLTPHATMTIPWSALLGQTNPNNPLINYQRNDLVNHFVLGDGVVTKVVGSEVFVAFNNPKFGVQAIAVTSPVLKKK